MNIRIGVTDNPREITVSVGGGADRAALRASIDAALAGEQPSLWLTDDQGREIAVASERIAYVEIMPTDSNPIGFG